MRTAAVVVMMSGTAIGLAALALLLGGLWDLATYALIGAGGFLIVGSLVGVLAAIRDRRHAA